MKRILSRVVSHSGAAVVAAGITLVAGVGATTSKVSTVQVVYVQNKSTVVTTTELKNALPAMQAALSKDFAPLWKVDGKLVFLPATSLVPVGAESITLVDNGPEKGALAFHELTNGVADSIIYAGVAKTYGYSWTVGFTHELWEMLADPGLVHAAQSPDGRVWAQENADPVESDADGYNRPGLDGKPVRISDFVTEKWFGAEIQGPFDFMNHIQKPLVIDKGGYAQWWNGTTWVLINNFVKGSAAARGIHW